MALLAVVSLLLVAAAAGLAVRAAARSGLRVTEQLRQIETYGFDAGLAAAPERSIAPAVRRAVESLGRASARVLTQVDLGAIRRELLSAGVYRVSPEAFLGYRVLAVISLPVLLAWYAVTLGVALPMALVMAVAGGLLGWRLPWVLLMRRATQRRERIDRALPELIDLLTVTVEAGMGLAGSLERVAGRVPDPLGAELRLTLQEQRMGLAVEQALGNLAQRCETASMHAFVRSLQHGETLGVSIGAILRNLAVDMRKRRRQSAEERAQKAPIKMLFPLVFLIFPAMFIVLLGPAIFQFLGTFGTL